MLAIGLGIRNVETTLPPLVYAVLSGFNSATVGLITLAALQLAERSIVCNITRLIVCTTACVGMLYRGISLRLHEPNCISFVVLPLIAGWIRGLDGYMEHTCSPGRLQLHSN